MNKSKLLDMSDSELRCKLVSETGYGYVLVTENLDLLQVSSFVCLVYPHISLLNKGDTVSDFEPVMKEILYFDEYGDQTHKVTEYDKILDCKVTHKQYGDEGYYFIEWWDETIKYNILATNYNYINRLDHDVKKTIEQVNQAQSSIVVGMATMVESRDNSTGGHVMRVSLGTRIFIDRLKESMDLTEDYWDCIKKAAPLHDIGKIAIDDDILRKPGKFTEDEFDFMKQHTVHGAEMLEKILMNVNDPEFKDIAINVAKYHHERYDGNGYPEGLAGTDIPFEARVLTLADVFDALVCRRVYKEAFDYDKAFKIISDEIGKQFDPFLCGIFLDCRQELIELYDSLVRE